MQNDKQQSFFCQCPVNVRLGIRNVAEHLRRAHGWSEVRAAHDAKEIVGIEKRKQYLERRARLLKKGIDIDKVDILAK